MRIFVWLRDLTAACVRHPLSLLGSMLASASAAIIVTVLSLSLLGFHENPYIGILIFLVLPALFVLGLLLIPLGLARERRRGGAFPVLDLNQPAHRGRFLVFCVLTFVNIVILATVSYRGVEYMDTSRFCGATCHTVMRPEYTAYQRSAHARVPCVSCHIGPGAGALVRSKLAGLRQVAALARGSYGRPIPVPVETLRPARDTCEGCHWPAKFHGERLEIKTKFTADEKNTPLKTVLILKIGGGSRESGFASGIHWHMNLATEIVFLPSDRSRATIPYVQVRSLDGRVTEYLAPGAERPTRETLERDGRRMDCVDCHNRPAHVFRPADQEVDDALLSGRIPAGLPWAKKAGVEILGRTYSSREEARRAIPAALAEYYRVNHPAVAADRAAEIARAGEVLAEVWRANVFPEMNVTWGTYPSQIGHMNSPGCFRCHDGEHVSPDGRAIGNDCDTCHNLLAVEEENPAVLNALVAR